ncbi:MAG TPA: methyltransferase domain-containing protein [Candidatus Bilamarchaeum sp.]|nr:methyltransferase domain-containing protein [Candidatus Bilamarchaeum sp.]
MLTKISEIEQLNADAQGLLDWAPVRLGSLLRTHAYSYPNWGITIAPENIDWLVSESKKAFSVEWADTDGSMNHMIAEASEKAGLADTNALMNAKIGQYASEVLIERFDGPSVLDIGAGAGDTSLAFLDTDRDSEAQTRNLVLLEPSAKRLETAEGRIRSFIRGTSYEGSLNLRLVHGSVDKLADFDDDSFDIIISNAAIHHESFNPHLAQIRRVLFPGMPFISGDWHESNYEHPARVYWIYYLLQNPHDEETAKAVTDFVLGGRGPLLTERKALGEFRERFSLSLMDLYDAYKGHTESERRADVGSMKYWLELGKRFSEEGKKCPEFLLQCHERVSKRVENLTNAGFVFDAESRSKYAEVIRERGFGELGAVMVAKKMANLRVR